MKQLSKRQRDIVRLIGTANSPTTGIELANALNVSLRTIQNEIKRINFESPVITSSNEAIVFPVILIQVTLSNSAHYSRGKLTSMFCFD